MNRVLVNKKTFNLTSVITDDWGGSHRVTIDLEAVNNVRNWQFGIELPSDYKIDQIYGAKLIESNGQTYLASEAWDKSMEAGEKNEIVLIIDEGNSSASAPVAAQYLFADSATNYTQSDSIVNANSQIIEDWEGGYKLELDLTAENNANNWSVEFNTPHTIKEVYGVDIIDNGNGNYTISGQNDQVNLLSGQSIKPVFILEDGGQQAQEFNIIDSSSETPVVVESEPVAVPVVEAPAVVEPEMSGKISAAPTITEDWEGGYKLELDLTAENNANNWSVEFNTPHTIKEVYGVDLIDNGNGNYTISGQNDQVNLSSGQSIKPVFILDDGGQQTQEFKIIDSSLQMEQEVEAPVIEPEPVAAPVVETPVVVEPEMSGKISAAPTITEDWEGGYKLEVEIKAEGDVNNWKADFNLPYSIKEAYGVDLVDNGNGNYTISGQNDQVNLSSGQSIKPVFILDDGGQRAVTPEFADTVDVVTPEPLSVPLATPVSKVNTPVNIPNSSGQSVGQRGQFSYGEALQKNFLFLEANRSGPLPADNRLEWRSDATVNDGSDVGRDLNGGYYDAGDHIKFIQPMAFSNTMLAWGGADYKEAYARSGQLDELLEAVKWGTDWFLKAHEMDSSGNTERLWVQVGDKTDHYHWVPAEEIANKTARPSFSIDRSRPGSDAAAGTASALASAAVLFRGTDDAYADELVKNAEALYEFAENYRGKYSDSVPQASPFYTSWSGDSDELTLGGAWLYRATGDSKYLSKAENYFKNEVGGLGDWSYATDDHSYAAATLLAKESSDPFFKGQTKNWLDTWVQGRGNVKYTSGGFAHRANWASVPLALSAAFSAEWYNDNVEANSQYSSFANKQTDYVLGDNPANFSYVVGFGDNYAKRTHHRGSAGTAPMDSSSRENDNLLYGAVVGGPGSVSDFSHNDVRTDWVTNEVGTSYNAPFAGAAIQQYDNLGGDPLSESDLDQLIGVDANGVGF